MLRASACAAVAAPLLAFAVHTGTLRDAHATHRSDPSATAGDARADARARTHQQAQVGTASVYARSLDGRTTANGERHDSTDLTAAHRTLPLGTRVRVTNLANRRAVVVRINDRGPAPKSRIIDLSRAAAARIGLHARGKGLARVRVEVLDAPSVQEAANAREALASAGPDDAGAMR